MQSQTEFEHTRYGRPSTQTPAKSKLAETASTSINISKNGSFRMRRISSFTNGNVRFKLDVCQSNLNDLETEIKELREETYQSSHFAAELSRMLVSQLTEKTDKTTERIRQLFSTAEETKLA